MAKNAAAAGGMKPAAAKAAIDQAKAMKGALTGKPRPCPPDRTADWEDCKEQVAKLESRKEELL